MKKINDLKVICVGWHKTGTSSIGDALIHLGYKVVGARLDLYDSLSKGDLKPAFEISKEFNALQDVPWAALYKELDNEYPGSKFILTIRDEEEWLNSAKKHFKSKNYEMHKWLYGKGVIDSNEKVYIERYKKHNKDVITYFKQRPNDFLVLNLSKNNGWESLCDFLDKPIPKIKFPFSNKGKHSLNFYDKTIFYIRKNTPYFLRRARIKFMEYFFQIPDKRDRFNNKQFNKPKLRKIKKK